MKHLREVVCCAAGPPASSPWTFGKPAPDTQSPAGGTSTGKAPCSLSHQPHQACLHHAPVSPCIARLSSRALSNSFLGCTLSCSHNAWQKGCVHVICSAELLCTGARSHWVSRLYVVTICDFQSCAAAAYAALSAVRKCRPARLPGQHRAGSGSLRLCAVHQLRLRSEQHAFIWRCCCARQLPDRRPGLVSLPRTEAAQR